MNIFVLSIFEWPLKTGFTVFESNVLPKKASGSLQQAAYSDIRRCSNSFHAFLSSADFFKINFFKKFFQEYQQCVKQFGKPHIFLNLFDKFNKVRFSFCCWHD